MAHRAKRPQLTMPRTQRTSAAERVVRRTGVGPFSGIRVGVPARSKPRLAQPSRAHTDRTIRRALKIKK